MAKVSIKSEKITPFGGIFHVREHFSRFVGLVIDKVPGLRCTSYGYQYSEIAGSLASVYHDFNTATKLNSLLVKVLMNTGQLVAGASYDLDFDHQFIETEKYDAKMTYKKFTGYSPGVPAKWIRTARHYQLNIYTDNKLYQTPFAFTDG